MRKLLNTLYVSTEGAYLHRDGLNVVTGLNEAGKSTLHQADHLFL